MKNRGEYTRAFLRFKTADPADRSGFAVRYFPDDDQAAQPAIDRAAAICAILRPVATLPVNTSF